MKAKVTAQGILIPREMLGDASEVEIRRENGHVVVVPLSSKDPIQGLGKNPVSCHAPDASEAHDQYLYGPSS